MADLQITGLPALAEAGIQATDVAAVADISATETKKVTIKDLIAAGVALIDDGDIPAAKVGTLGTNQVASAAIQANAVTAAKIASGTITATEIADATITGAKLVNDTVTATQIAANAITASELADNAVDTAAIAANAVTTAKITDANVTYAKLSLSDGDIPGAKIATGGITATQLAANSVAASELADDAVDTAAIVDGAVTAVKIATNTITANQIAANAIGASELADNAVDTAAIADGAVTAAKLSGTLGTSSIADDAVTTAKIVDDAVTSAKLAANAVDAAALADNAVDSGAIASSAVVEAKIASNAVTVTKIADGTITPAKLNSSNLDRSINIASGNLGINNTITAATRSGITYNAQGLITGTVALAAGDLPVATTSAVGGVSIASAGGLSVSGAGALSIAATVTAGTATKVSFNGFGQITSTASLAAADLPLATASAVGGVSIPSGGPLSVDGNGALTVSNSGVSAGTGAKVTVDAKGIVTALANLADSDLPNHSAALLTSGTIDAARIGASSITGAKLSNASTAIFQSIAQSGYPTAQFNGQILFDTVSEDAYIWDGNAWQAITTLTKGSLVFGGNFNANTSKMTACTSAGLAAGLAVGSNLPTPSATTDGLYVVVDTAGTPSAPAPVVAFSPPDYILGVTNASGSSWNEIDLSQTVAGQVASNITFTPYGQLSSTNVQDALQELETEKLALAGGTVTGQVLIGNTGSLVFEGSTVDAFETTLTVADPTTSDKTITLPNVTGTVITTGDTGTVTSTMIADGTIVNADINASAAIALTKLANVTSAQIIVGNGSNVPTAVAVTGDIAITNAGVTSIAAGVIVDADISGSAQITGSKVVTGTTSAVGVLQLTNAADSTSATTAATPAAVKTAKDAADAAATTANAALPKAGGVLTGHLTLDDEKELRFREEDAGGDHYIALKAAAALAADVTLTLPAVAPTAGQVLKANASTPTTLEWGTDSATDSTKMPLAGGTFTGDVTFTGDSSNGLWDKSASAFVANLTGNVTGNASGSAATVTGAAQSAITSLGTLTGLTVSGDVSIADKIVHTGDTDTAIRFSGDDTISIETAGVTRATVTGNNIDLPDAGTLRFGASNDLQIYHGTGGASNIVHSNTAQPLIINASGAGTIRLDTDSTERARIDSSGNVLIGTTTAQSGSDANSKLQLFTSSGAKLLIGREDSSISSGNFLGMVDFHGTDGTSSQRCARVGAVASGDHATDDKPTDLVFQTCADGAGTSAERMRIDSSGNVGIGTTTPDTKLHVHNGSAGSIAAHANANLTIESSASDYNILQFLSPATAAQQIRFGDPSDNGAGYIQYNHSSNQLVFGANGPARMRIDSSGCLLVGTDEQTTQQYTSFAQQIYSSGGEQLLLGRAATAHQGPSMYFTKTRNATWGSNTIVADDDFVGALYFTADDGTDYKTEAAIIQVNIDGTPGANDMPGRIVFKTTSDGGSVPAERMRLDSAGHLGIGTTSPAKTLDIVGDDIRATSNVAGSHFNLRLRGQDTSTGGAIIGLNSADNAGPLKFYSGNNVVLALDTSENATFSGTVSDSKGDLRKIPKVTQAGSGDYTLVVADAEKAVKRSNGKVIVPSGTFAGGDVVTIVNASGSDIAIDQGSSLTLYNAADAATGNRTLAGRGVATVWFDTNAIAYISGAGLS